MADSRDLIEFKYQSDRPDPWVSREAWQNQINFYTRLGDCVMAIVLGRRRMERHFFMLDKGDE